MLEMSTYPLECMLSKMEMDSMAIQATISDDMLEVFRHKLLQTGRGEKKGRKKQWQPLGEVRGSRVKELTIGLMNSMNPTS